MFEKSWKQRAAVNIGLKLVQPVLKLLFPFKGPSIVAVTSYSGEQHYNPYRVHLFQEVPFT
jgi:hypothetical protein